MRTTIDLSDELFREVKTFAAQRGKTLKQLVAQFIVAGLESQAVVSNSTIRRVAPPVAIPRTSGQPLTPALTGRQLNALLDEEDSKRFSNGHKS
jgi:hypothetical protein